jgi:hypothetical protein
MNIPEHLLFAFFEIFYKLIYNQLVTELLKYAGKLIICDDMGDTFAMGCEA